MAARVLNVTADWSIFAGSPAYERKARRIIAEHGGGGARWAEADACSLAGKESIACEGEPGCVVLEAPLCSAEIPPGALSYYIARSRIMAAIGSPQAAAVANAQAPRGAQLGLL